MDTNLSQAIKLAGGVLIAVVIISALMYFFTSLSPVQTGLEDIKALEQTEAFNKEYEVYKKDLMYGVDVISVLNKAASMNKSYIDEYEYSEDLKENYLVEITFTLSEPVEEFLQIYYANRIGADGRIQEFECYENYLNFEPFNNLTDPVFNIENEILDKLDIGVDPPNSAQRDTLARREKYEILDAGEYTLIDEHNEEDDYCNDDVYEAIIKNSKNMKKTIKNKVGDAELRIGEWTKAIYTTGAYSFKSKKFRCTGITYSNVTGRINSLTFVEI